jgi:transcriptional antiterminator
MAGLKFYERTKLLIELIEKKKTGSPAELAVKLGMKERTIYNVLDDLRLSLGMEILYFNESKSFVFQEKNN